MKKLFILAAIPFLIAAGPINYRLDTSSTNLAATFANSPVLSATTNFANIQVDNQTASEIAINCSSVLKPSVNATPEIRIAGYTAYEPPSYLDMIPYPFGQNCWLRSYSGTISSGIIRITGWQY